MTKPFPSTTKASIPLKPHGITRAWFDGCFDLMHYGHINALRQTKALCDELIVGIHSDAEIRQHKRTPIMSESERYALVKSCRFVDFIVMNVPYCTSLAMLRAYDIDFAVHGDDITTTADGENSYQDVIDAGMMRYVSRTGGVSSSDVVEWVRKGREHPTDPHSPAETVLRSCLTEASNVMYFTDLEAVNANNRVNLSWLDSHTSVAFIHENFDLFNKNDASLLAVVKSMVDVVLVGINDGGDNERPTMFTLPERCVMLAGNRFVDGVVSCRREIDMKVLLKALGVRVYVSPNTRVHFDGIVSVTIGDGFAGGKQRITQTIRNIYGE